jgi:hypothetical protein
MDDSNSFVLPIKQSYANMQSIDESKNISSLNDSPQLTISHLVDDFSITVLPQDCQDSDESIDLN